MKEIIFPKSLKKGDKIAIISPAGFVEEAPLQSTLNLIQSKGYEPVFGKHTLGKFVNGYNYSGTEKERIQDLNWALNKINKNRFPGENLEAKKARNDVSYFRVPLAKGGFGSDLVAKGLLKSLKDRFYSLNPATALRQLKEKTEGIFNPDDSTQTNQNLFEMNNIFDNGEND